jgi:AGZA family xanthine/uracil permease-like MFS transporter
MLPLAVILITYFSRIRFPLGLPGGLVAVVLGTVSAWTLPFVLPETIAGPAMSIANVKQAAGEAALCLPRFVGADIAAVLSKPADWLGFLSVIVPMGLFNVIGSLQNIESAEAAGDCYDTRSSLAINGVGTIVAAMFGSCFPTTIYIGHPGWKGLRARAGYSTLNGIAVAAICLSGTVGLIGHIVPIEAGIAIVLWIGIIMTAQAFQATPKDHAPAVAIGLFPAIAAWGWTVAQGTFIAAGGKTAQELLVSDHAVQVNGFLIHGMIVMERGYIFTCMILAAIAAFLIDRKFYTATVWSVVAAAFAFVGLTHAYQIFGIAGKPGNIIDFLFAFQQPIDGALAFRASGIAIGYLMFAAVIAACGWYYARTGAPRG